MTIEVEGKSHALGTPVIDSPHNGQYVDVVESISCVYKEEAFQDLPH